MANYWPQQNHSLLIAPCSSNWRIFSLRLSPHRQNQPRDPQFWYYTLAWLFLAVLCFFSCARQGTFVCFKHSRRFIVRILMSHICKISVKNLQFPIHLLGRNSKAQLNSRQFMSSATSVCAKLSTLSQKRQIIEICDNVTSCREQIMIRLVQGFFLFFPLILFLCSWDAVTTSLHCFWPWPLLEWSHKDAANRSLKPSIVLPHHTENVKMRVMNWQKRREKKPFWEWQSLSSGARVMGLNSTRRTNKDKFPQKQESLKNLKERWKMEPHLIHAKGASDAQTAD